MKKTLILMIVLSATSAAQAGDPVAGKAKSGTCVACHNNNGISVIPSYPNIAGQKEQYLIDSLQAYRAGKRKGGQSAVMTPMAANLSDEDIADLAAYYASLPAGSR